ncbi:hypothetical protein J2X68_001033 [Streptomyces sp. 3330]|uniref:hypothetical protein n=1 Tax=Streptomyces sp. 3330 TaxID=2817755 RepID=UPI0028594F55|nr:hypothetical protein [Streptomyces sp. 3330]MDR6974355.1 hypothetical protein [Streptomyces sp. 3330]
MAFECLIGRPAARRAFLRTALLRPFTDCNLVIGRACTSQYLHVSGRPLSAKDHELYELARAIRAPEADLRAVAQRLESWRTA